MNNRVLHFGAGLICGVLLTVAMMPHIDFTSDNTITALIIIALCCWVSLLMFTLLTMTPYGGNHDTEA